MSEYYNLGKCEVCGADCWEPDCGFSWGGYLFCPYHAGSEIVTLGDLSAIRYAPLYGFTGYEEWRRKAIERDKLLRELGPKIEVSLN